MKYDEVTRRAKVGNYAGIAAVSIECPYCGGSLVQDGSQMILLEDVKDHALLHCCDCLEWAQIPQLVIRQEERR